MSDALFKICGNIEKSYLKGRNCHKLTDVENAYMVRNRKDVLSMLSDFDNINCLYDEIACEVIFVK